MLGGGDKLEKLDVRHAYLQGGSQDKNKELFSFYWYFTLFDHPLAKLQNFKAQNTNVDKMVSNNQQCSADSKKHIYIMGSSP